ncbi:MAG: adenylate/guanylate cyclase domain-containing protein, partial [bacterium]|nr:adenylate/guanylate cyclase domain-containing protein [bacterium]
ISAKDQSVVLLSDICRLLIQRGTRQSFIVGLELSFALHNLEREHATNHILSSFLKGLFQIGLGQYDLGIKNISYTIRHADEKTLTSHDRMMASWGLVSAAISFRDLSLALRFAGEWRDRAMQHSCINEAIRAELIILLLNILSEDRQALSIMDRTGFADVPQDLQGAVSYLTAWADTLAGAAGAAESCRQSLSKELYNTHWHACLFGLSRQAFDGSYEETSAIPLLLGLDWCVPGRPRLTESALSSFSTLCQVRSWYCDPSALSDLSRDELTSIADMLSRWELAVPLRTVEYKRRDEYPEDFYKSIMTRTLGPHPTEAICDVTSSVTGAQRKESIVWMSDIKGYSAMSETIDPKDIFELLSPLFKIMNEELEEAGGMILEFVGDSIFVVFNVFDKQHSTIEQVFARTTTCIERLRSFGLLCRVTGKPSIRIGVGINKGMVALGYLGGLSRCHLGTLGNTVNIAARIEGLTRELPCAVAVDDAVFNNRMPDIWRDPAWINFSLRNLGEHALKNIKKSAHIYGLNPLIRSWVDFVPMGFVATPQPGIIYLDVGNSCEPGIIDHHSAPQEGDCACEVIVRKPEFITGYVKNRSLDEIEFRLHNEPDMDCASSLYCAYELLEAQPRHMLLKQLAAYVSKIDQGFFPGAEYYLDSLYGIFLAHQNMISKHLRRKATNHELLLAGMRVIDAALFLADNVSGPVNFSRIFETMPGWFPEERAWLKSDRLKYEHDFNSTQRYRAYANCCEPEKVEWLYFVTVPESSLFKVWARNDTNAPGGNGFKFLTVDCSSKGKGRFVISVDPETVFHLNGLGQDLEKEESIRRSELGRERQVEPRRYPTDNSDPWYFGQGHNYTIIDSPSCGTVLTPDEIIAIHRAWEPGQE